MQHKQLLPSAIEDDITDARNIPLKQKIDGTVIDIPVIAE